MQNCALTAVFGVVWKYFHFESVTLTINEFKEGCEVSYSQIHNYWGDLLRAINCPQYLLVQDAFQLTDLKLSYKELIAVVPDYKSWIKPHIDPTLGCKFSHHNY